VVTTDDMRSICLDVCDFPEIYCNASLSIGARKFFCDGRDLLREKYFEQLDAPQLQPDPQVRARKENYIDNLSHELAITPLTAVLAGVKSATRIDSKSGRFTLRW
jgi:hypothetical protein